MTITFNRSNMVDVDDNIKFIFEFNAFKGSGISKVIVKVEDRIIR